jgi:3-deoxy-manno-octulosonate cytidylyltransferase (CMP-KDO synthetase)
MSTFKVVIPARFGSTRLPAKAIVDIGGRPMIQWVVDAALRSGALEVIVATDDARVAQSVDASDPRASVVMTRTDHVSGTDRIAEVAIGRGWDDTDIVVNVQGDEPLLPPALIDQVAELLAGDARAHLATLSTQIDSVAEFLDPNAVKVVTADDASALYFSRAPVPWVRDGATHGLTSQTAVGAAQRHLGIYAYRVAGLKRLTALPPSTLELAEKLEQLRALQAGMRILVAVAAVAPGTGVDTEEDLARVRSIVAGRITGSV